MVHIVSSDRIIQEPPVSDGLFRFKLPVSYDPSKVFDMAAYLEANRNEELLSERRPQKYGEVYSEMLEYERFEELLEKALDSGGSLHIENVSLCTITERLKKLYSELGYFVESLNAFVVDPKTAPVTVGVHLKSFVYSTKDMYLLGESLFSIVPPPRSPTHQKGLMAALNSGVISRIGTSEGDEALLADFLRNENIALTKAAATLYDNYVKIGNPEDFRFVDLKLD